MSVSRAVLRRLDPWAVMLLGVLVALGVIILLSTPGPWRRVVPATPRVQVGPPPPRDVAVFVRGCTDDDACTGVVWVHVRYDRPSLTAIVVPVRTTCLLPGAGMQPLDEIVRDAGPAVAAAALGETLGVELGGYVDLRRTALLEAFPGPAEGTSAARLYMKAVNRAWTTRGEGAGLMRRQTRFLRAAVAAWRRARFDAISFANYVIGSPEAVTGMKLPAVAAIGRAIEEAPRERLTVGALPAVAHVRGAYERWCVDRYAVAAYKAAFAFGAMQPSPAPDVRVERALPRVIVLGDWPLARLQWLAAGVRAVVARRSGHDVTVEAVVCRSRGALRAALSKGPKAGSPLAVVIAFGPSQKDDDDSRSAALTESALAEVTAQALPAIVATPGPRAGQDDGPAAGPDAEAGFPLVAGVAGSGTATAARGPRPWRLLGGSVGECLVRAVQPAFFSPRLPATRMRVSYYARREIAVDLVGGDADVAQAMAARLAVIGYRPSTVSEADVAAAGVVTVHHDDETKRDAWCVASDVDLGRRRLIPDEEAGGRVTLVLPWSD